MQPIAFRKLVKYLSNLYFSVKSDYARGTKLFAKKNIPSFEQEFSELWTELSRFQTQ